MDTPNVPYEGIGDPVSKARLAFEWARAIYESRGEHEALRERANMAVAASAGSAHARRIAHAFDMLLDR